MLSHCNNLDESLPIAVENCWFFNLFYGQRGINRSSTADEIIVGAKDSVQSFSEHIGANGEEFCWFRMLLSFCDGPQNFKSTPKLWFDACCGNSTASNVFPCSVYVRPARYAIGCICMEKDIEIVRGKNHRQMSKIRSLRENIIVNLLLLGDGPP